MTKRIHGITPILAMALSIMCLAVTAAPLSAWADNGDYAAAQSSQITMSAQSDAPLSAQASAESNPNITSRVKASEFAGATMYETAVSQAKAAYPDGTESAIIVGPGDAWIDALSASSLAAFKGPILYADKDSMNDASLQALEDLGVTSVIIIGGTDAVGVGVEKGLVAKGISVEERLGGEKYYDTQLAIFNYGVDNDLWSKDLVMLATGSAFGDALSASPVAFAKKAPIFVTAPGNSLTAAQKAAWGTAAAQGYGKQVVIVGGPAAISDASRDYAATMSETANGSENVEWLWGATQYETSVEIAEWAVDEQGFSWNNIAYTTGLAPWDALAGSVLQGKDSAVLLLADSMDHATIAAAKSHKASITDLRLFGGKRATTPNVRMALADALDFPAAALPSFKVYLDAGHGFNDSGYGIYDPGAIGSGYQEATLTKELVNLIAPQLRAKGVDVFVNDDGGPYRLRHSEAYAQGCDEIISIHFNASGGSGSMSLIHEYNANEYSSRLQQKIHPYLIEGMGLHDYGMRSQQVAILGGPLPAVLLEVCFIDNASDMSAYQARKDTVAMALARGIMA